MSSDNRMRLTKSLFVEYTTNPHTARRHIHDKDGVYAQILKKMYGDMDGMAIGQAVEDQALALFQGKNIVNVESIQRRHPDWYQGYFLKTLDAFQSNPDVVYQAGLSYDNLFCKCDLLVKNEQGTYDLREVKAKNNVRKKTKAMPLLDDMDADVSFQHFLLQKTLKEKYSGRAFLVYLNKEYVKHGEIDPGELIQREEVTNELKTEEAVMNIVASMTERLPLTREEFLKLYPYDGSDHLTYFGTEPEKGSVRYIPQIRTKTKEFYEIGKTLIEHFTEDERSMLLASNGEESKASQYVSLRQKGEQVVNAEGIKQKIENIHFPIYFYDYETISRPVPLMEGTSPWQQVVVQYSVHRMDADGTISHKEAIVGSGTIDNETIVKQLVDDLDEGVGTYVVWFKGFENTRNDEMAQRYPQYADIFAKINENTFDLMEIFSEQLYFHRKFHGSSSIKKVLPVLTDISYDNMEVPHGAIAAELLAGIVQGKFPTDICNKHTQDLLDYCKQDTRAMVRIYQRVLEEIRDEKKLPL